MRFFLWLLHQDKFNTNVNRAHLIRMLIELVVNPELVRYARIVKLPWNLLCICFVIVLLHKKFGLAALLL